MDPDNKKVDPALTSANSRYTVGEATRMFIGRLSPKFGEQEAAAMVRVIWEDLKGYTPTQQIINSDLHVSEYMLAKITAVIDRVLADEPLQYVLGQARFYGMNLRVTPAVLIPRPETAELVDIIVDHEGSKSDLSVLDVGTGSGCIAIALSRNLPFSRLTAIDVSEAALEVARENALQFHARINFEKVDILKAQLPAQPLYDIVVSNPPYIMGSERSSMESYVADHEPAEALFVPDNDPLLFYNAICRYAWEALYDGGRIYFELNPLTADNLAANMRSTGWTSVGVQLDSQGLKRFLTAVRPQR